MIPQVAPEGTLSENRDHALNSAKHVHQMSSRGGASQSTRIAIKVSQSVCCRMNRTSLESQLAMVDRGIAEAHADADRMWKRIADLRRNGRVVNEWTYFRRMRGKAR